MNINDVMIYGEREDLLRKTSPVYREPREIWLDMYGKPLLERDDVHLIKKDKFIQLVAEIKAKGTSYINAIVLDTI